MKKRKISVYSLAKDLHLTILSHLDSSKKLWIKEYGVNRAGLELTGLLQETNSVSKRCILLGGKESRFLSTFKNKEDLLISLSHILHSEPPVVIVTKTFRQINELKQTLEASKIPILRSSYSTHDTSYFLSSYINTRIWERLEVHATLMNVYGRGVLITGESGIGKSELALGLLKRGHFFISDDRVSLYTNGASLYGEAANPIAKLIEIRGIGVIDVKKMYGFHVTLKDSSIDLIVHFVVGNKGDIQRTGFIENTEHIFSHNIAKVIIPVMPGRNLMDLVETSVIALKLKQEGYDPSKELDHLVKAEIKKNFKEDQLIKESLKKETEE